MRRWLLTLALVLAPVCVSAQIIHTSPGSGGSGSFTSPGQGIIVDTDGAGSLDNRSFVSSGGSLVCANADGSGGNIDCDIDFAQVPRYIGATSAPPGTCSLGTFHIRTDTHAISICSDNSNTWTGLVTGSGSVSGTNTGDVTLAGTPDYITIAGQVITRGSIDLTTDVTGDLPLSNVAQASGASVLLGRGSAGGAGDFQEITLGSGLTMTSQSLSASGSAVDASTTITQVEEFLTGGSAHGSWGSQGLTGGVIGTGTQVMASNLAGHPGMHRLNSHATNDDSGASITWENASAGATNWGASWDTTVWSIDAIIQPGAGGTAITSTGFYFGLGGVAATSDADGAANFIGFVRNTDDSHAAFVARVCDSASNGCGSAGDDTNQESAVSTITPSAGTWYRFRISQDFTGPGSSRKISMRVNDETAITFCSSTCTDTISQAPGAVALRPIFQYLTRTTTGVLAANIDYWAITLTVAARY